MQVYVLQHSPTMQRLPLAILFLTITAFSFAFTVHPAGTTRFIVSAATCTCCTGGRYDRLYDANYDIVKPASSQSPRAAGLRKDSFGRKASRSASPTRSRPETPGAFLSPTSTGGNGKGKDLGGKFDMAGAGAAGKPESLV